MSMTEIELLEKQVSLMKMAEKHGIKDWRELVLLHIVDETYQFMNEESVAHYYLQDSLEYKFALGVVEGKPVFEGDRLYYKGVLQTYTPDKLRPEEWSWEPKTVMVELPRGDVELWAGYRMVDPRHEPSVRLYKACHVALLKEKDVSC